MTDIRFRPTGNSAHRASPAFVFLSSLHFYLALSLTRALTRPVPRAFRMNGNAFRKEGHTETMNQLLFWMKRRWWIGGGRAPGLREMTMAEGKPNFRVVERLKIKIGECFPYQNIWGHFWYLWFLPTLTRASVGPPTHGDLYTKFQLKTQFFFFSVKVMQRIWVRGIHHLEMDIVQSLLIRKRYSVLPLSRRL